MSITPLIKTIASNLLTLRERKNIKQKEMAQMSDMSQANFSDIERGITKPSVENLMKFAYILDVSIEVLTAEDMSVQNEITLEKTCHCGEIIDEKNRRIEFLERLVIKLTQLSKV